MKLNERIIQLRKDKGLTQEDLASYMKVDTQLIIDWEKGELEPNASELINLAKVLNVSLDELVYSYKDNFEEPIYKNEVFYIVKKIILMLSLLVCLIAYIVIGILLNLWHPGWIIFFLIPAVPTILYSHKNNIQSYIVDVICMLIFIGYFVVGFVFKIWHPTWVAFLVIPVLLILFDKDK